MDTVLSHVRTANGLSAEDIREMDVSSKEVMSYLDKNKNKTQLILIFCSNSSWNVGQFEVPCYANDYHLNFYTIVYNLSLFHKTPYMGNLK